ncbi:hypothetical protein OSB04_017511 [Centaurea solstitialis]|uniref:Uncharacterized protein n=1 Tax=Centaurea solstitialis TaxID=347529 RepID=A0AA38TE02_9ASTR|nr:hypothetical protein OSB04_017511 [Centaurea solstitialis]
MEGLYQLLAKEKHVIKEIDIGSERCYFYQQIVVRRKEKHSPNLQMLLLGIGIENKSRQKYIGVPSVDNMSSTKAWDPIIENFQRRPSKWKAKALFLSATLLLIFSQSIKHPWPSLDRGGLGFGSIAAANTDLLSKWVWEFHFNSNSI